MVRSKIIQNNIGIYKKHALERRNMNKPGLTSIFMLMLTFTTACFGGIFLFKQVKQEQPQTSSVKPGYIFTRMKSKSPKEKFNDMIRLKEQELSNLLRDVRLANKQLYISSTGKKGKAAQSVFKGVLDINKAKADEFTQIKGIGKGTAENIIEYRQKHGPFMSVNDLTKVKRIGPATIKRIGKFLKVDDKIAAQAQAQKSSDSQIDPKGNNSNKDSKNTINEIQININTATLTDLSGLSGVGPATATAIIEERTKNGPYKNADDLKRVKGIGPALIEKNRQSIVTGPVKAPESTVSPQTTMEDMSSMILNDLNKEVKSQDTDIKPENPKLTNPDKSKPDKSKPDKSKPDKSKPDSTLNKININTAGKDKLCEIKGIGPSAAGRIIDYRKEKGLFKSIEDLKNIKGIGPKTFEKLKDSICVESGVK
jgi:competence protein ComEA